MAEIVYAVHTRACTYLLDDEGFCRWVLSRSGAKSDDRCVGAQFVAALDLHSKGGLIGELRIGASALFIRSENGRFVLIRTKPIEHVEARGEGEDFPPEPEEEEPVVLPDRLAVAAVFDAPTSAREPEPPSARVILQNPQRRTEPPPPYSHPIASPRTEPLPGSSPPPPPQPAPIRSFPKAPPRTYPEPPPPVVEPPHRAFPEPPPRVPTQQMRSFPEPPPRVSEPPRRAFPEPPPRVPVEPPRAFGEPPPGFGEPPRGFGDRPSRRSARDASSETQPLPPSGPVPAWPPMLAPPPPQAEMLPLGPARPHLPSSEELDVGDLEEVQEDDQIYSMEVTLTMPLFKGDPAAAHHFRR